MQGAKVFKLGNQSKAFSTFKKYASGVRPEEEPAKKKARKNEQEQPQQQPQVTQKIQQAILQPTPAQPTGEERENIRKLVWKISEYKRRFPDRFTHLELEGLAGKSASELQLIVQDAQATLSASSNSSFFILAAGVGVNFWEKGAKTIGYRVDGLGACLQQDREWNDLIAELELLHSDLHTLPPHERAFIKLLQTTMAVHKLNTLALVANKPGDNTIVPQSVVDKYKDL